MGSISLIIALGLVFFVIILIRRALLIVPSVFQVSRLGAASRILRPGLHIIIPFLETVTQEISLDSQEVTLPEQRCLSLQDSYVVVSGKIFYRISDPKKLPDRKLDLSFTLLKLAQDFLIKTTQDFSEWTLCQRKEALEEGLRKDLSARFKKFEIAIESVDLEIRPSIGKVA